MNQKLKLVISLLIASLFSLVLTSCNNEPDDTNGDTLPPRYYTLTLDLNIDFDPLDDNFNFSISLFEYNIMYNVNVYQFMYILDTSGTLRLANQQHGLHNFVGWALDPDGEVLLNNTLYVTEDLTLYAVWDQPAYHEIQFVIHEKFTSINELLADETKELQETESILAFINELLYNGEIDLDDYTLADNESFRWSFKRTAAPNTLDDNGDEDVITPPPTVGNTVINSNTAMPTHNITVYLWLYTEVVADVDDVINPFPYQGRVITMLVVSILIVTLVPTGIIIASKLKND